MMTPTERITLCKILDLMEQHPEFSKQLGLENKSSFQGKLIDTNNSHLQKNKPIFKEESL